MPQPATTTAGLPRGRLLTNSIAAYLTSQTGLTDVPAIVWEQQDPKTEVNEKLKRATGQVLVIWETGFGPADERAPNDILVRLTVDLIAKPVLQGVLLTDLAVLVDQALRRMAPDRNSGYNRDIAETLNANRTSIEGHPVYRYTFSLRTKADAPNLFDPDTGPQTLT